MSGPSSLIPQVKPWLGRPEEKILSEVIHSGWLTEGPYCRDFSKELLQLIGAPFGVFAPNGTLALALGMLALGIGQGDEVIVPDITFAGSASAVILTGAVPIFVDIEREFCQIDVTKIEAAITPRTKAIMPVHLFGTACDMTEIMNLALVHNLFVVEDACQGIGVKYRDQHVGSFGDIGCFSFFADKTITTGEGGFVVCRDKEVYENLLLLRNQGRKSSGAFVHEAVGWNFRITEMQAALGVCQLAKLPTIIQRKLELFQIYCEALSDVDEVRILFEAPNANIVPFRFVLFVPNVNELRAYLEDNKVQTRGFFYPMHSQPCFSYLGQQHGEFLIAQHAHESGICLPIYPTMANQDASEIGSLIRTFYK